MQVMIDKGDPSCAEFDDKIAEGAARLFRRERKDGDRRDDERGSDDAGRSRRSRDETNWRREITPARTLRRADRESSSGGGAIVVVRVQVYESYIARRVVFRPRRTRTHLGRTTRFRTELGSAPLFRRTSLYQSFPRLRRNLRSAATAEHSRARSDANDASRSRCRRDATTVTTGTTWRRLSPSRALSSSWRCTRSPSPTRCVRRNPRALVPPRPSRSTSLTRTRASFPPDDAPTG